MATALLVVQIISALLLLVAIMLQEKGSGLGEALTGSASASFQTTKRGAEKLLARATVVLMVLFVGLSLALNFV